MNGHGRFKVKIYRLNTKHCDFAEKLFINIPQVDSREHTHDTYIISNNTPAILAKIRGSYYFDETIA